MPDVLRLVLILPVLLLGLSTASAKDIDKAELHRKVEQIKKDWQAKDRSFDATLKKAHAYAIFPEIGKGGFIVGASHGSGEVYEGGKLIGYSKMTQTTVGAQVGGQTFAEVILFRDQKALDRFKGGRFEGSAAATAIGGKRARPRHRSTRTVLRSGCSRSREPWLKPPPAVRSSLSSRSQSQSKNRPKHRSRNRSENRKALPILAFAVLTLGAA